MRVTGRMMTGHRRLIHRDTFHAVMLKGKPINHLLFLIAAPFTFGIGLLIWLYHIWRGGERREMMEVDEYGVVYVWTAFDQDQASQLASIALFILLIPWFILALVVVPATVIATVNFFSILLRLAW